MRLKAKNQNEAIMEKFNLQSCKSAKYAKTVMTTAPKAVPVGNQAAN